MSLLAHKCSLFSFGLLSQAFDRREEKGPQTCQKLHWRLRNNGTPCTFFDTLRTPDFPSAQESTSSFVCWISAALQIDIGSTGWRASRWLDQHGHLSCQKEQGKRTREWEKCFNCYRNLDSFRWDLFEKCVGNRMRWKGARPIQQSNGNFCGFSDQKLQNPFQIMKKEHFGAIIRACVCVDHTKKRC